MGNLEIESGVFEKLNVLEEQYVLLQGRYDDRNTILKKQIAEIQHLKDEIEQLTDDNTMRTVAYDSLKEKYDALRQEIVSLKDQLAEKAAAYEKVQKEIDALSENYEAAEEELEEEKQAFEKLKVEFSHQNVQLVEVVHLQSKVSFLMEQVQILEEKHRDHLSKLTSLEILQAKNETLTRNLEEMDQMLKKYAQAEIEFNRIDEMKEVYSRLEKRANYLEEENQKLRAQLDEERDMARQYRQDAERVKTAEYEKDFYEIRTRNLEYEIKRYKKREQDAITDEGRLFESFQVLIEKAQKTADTLEHYPKNDEVIVNRVMEVAEKGQYEFSREIVEGFLASMRSTRFIILKGLSGTGKTSLPKIVAHALGGICETIAVQPSWKSKTDLIGFYNHFNERFMATSFTEELFKAQLPENRDKFYFIVLDEMNLARVEYYFSDFNSKLELEESKQVIELFDTLGRTSGALSEYIIDGNKLRIPPNVFFVGTINEDDSTYTLSDKIYDRAQVLDFQSALSKKVGNMSLVQSMPSVRFSDFKNMNEQLTNYDVSKMMHPINKILETLSKDLYLEFGNRPRRHMQTFLQAYAYNNWSEAHGIDLQIVSKIVPKIMPSYDELFLNTIDKIIAIANHNKKDCLTEKALQKVKRNAQ